MGGKNTKNQKRKSVPKKANQYKSQKKKSTSSNSASKKKKKKRTPTLEVLFLILFLIYLYPTVYRYTQENLSQSTDVQAAIAAPKSGDSNLEEFLMSKNFTKHLSYSPTYRLFERDSDRILLSKRKEGDVPTLPEGIDGRIEEMNGVEYATFKNSSTGLYHATIMSGDDEIWMRVGNEGEIGEVIEHMQKILNP